MKMIKVMSKKLVRKAIEMIRAIYEESEYEYVDEEDDDQQYQETDDDQTTETTEEEDEEKKDKNEESETTEEKEGEEEEETKYDIFWKNFGKSIKLGVIEDSSNRLKLAKLLRFPSTNDPEGLTSLDEYISRMKDDQDTILYLPGDSKEQVLKSPILKKYVNQGYEVLILSDPIDEFTTQHLSEYEKRKVKSIAKDDVSILESNSEDDKKKHQKLKEMYKPLTDWYKNHLGRKVEKVSISNKLEDAPLFIFTSQYGYSAQMEKINKAQAFQNSEKAPSYMLAKKTLELNPSHPVMKLMLEQIKEKETLDDITIEYADLLFNMALMNSGFNVDNPVELTEPLEKLIKVGFGLEREAPCEDIAVEIDQEEEETEEEEEEVEEVSTDETEKTEETADKAEETPEDSQQESTEEKNEQASYTDDL